MAHFQLLMPLRFPTRRPLSVHCSEVYYMTVLGGMWRTRDWRYSDQGWKDDREQSFTLERWPLQETANPYGQGVNSAVSLGLRCLLKALILLRIRNVLVTQSNQCTVSIIIALKIFVIDSASGNCLIVFGRSLLPQFLRSVTAGQTDPYSACTVDVHSREWLSVELWQVSK